MALGSSLCAVEPSPAPFSAQPPFVESAPIPFEVEDGLLWVKVDGGRKSLDFVFDSGSGSTFLSVRAARRLRLPMTPAHTVKGVERQTPAFDVGEFSLTLGNVALRRTFRALDLPERRIRRPGRVRQIDGLLGQDFFRGRVVEIDYRTRRIRVLERPAPVSGAMVLPIRIHGDAMCVPVSVNGLPPKWTRLDTGCSTALEWSDQVVVPTASAAVSTALAVRTSVRVGTETIPNVRVNLHAQPIFPMEAGLLGNGILCRYRVTVDGRQLRLYLEKR